MICVAAEQCGDSWFGVAWEGEGLVATAIGTTRDSALLNLRRCLPAGVSPPQGATDVAFFRTVATMLCELERGDESHKQFTLSPALSEPLRRILTVAAAIPVGYVSTYGDIARAAGSQARAVGRVMATNPLYPVVPCHRVVGARFDMVGYGGRQDEAALTAKLGRLRAEARGAAGPREISLTAAGPAVARLPEGAPRLAPLAVYPVERVLAAAPGHAERRRLAARGAEQEQAAERRQLPLL